MQKPYFRITPETELINEDFVKIEAYLYGGKRHYAINTKEIVGFDFENLCILFKNEYPLFLYEDYQKSKKQHAKLKTTENDKCYIFAREIGNGGVDRWREGIIDRLKRDFLCKLAHCNIILPKTNAVISKAYELPFLSWAYRLFNPRTAFDLVVEDIKRILQEEIDEENEKIDIDNEEIDRQNEEWKANKIKVKSTIDHLAELTTKIIKNN